MEAARTPPIFAVHEDCWESVQVFLDASRQWRESPTGRVLGLDWQGVLAVLTMTGRQPSRALFDDLRIMEAAVLKAVKED